MDELDALLEELAKTTHHAAPEVTPDNSDQPVGTEQNAATDGGAAFTGQVQPVYTTRFPVKKEGDEDEEHVYSELPEPQPCLLSPNSASRELDDIMKGLLQLDLEIGESPESSCYSVISGKKQAKGEDSKPPKTTVHSSKTSQEIDDLLGDLSSGMEKMGVKTTVIGDCAACGKCITGKVVTALGVTWHAEHFVCAHCGVELCSRGFFERDGKAYCDTDYHNLFSPRCAYCSGPILQKVLAALNKTWHPEHFFCSECGRVFGDDGFHEKDGKPYCKPDFYRLYAPKCSGCGEPVRENYLSAAGGQWHPDCFVCADCMSPFLDGCFFELDGRPYCQIHYHARQGTLCGGCQAPILGRCVSAMGRKFHPEHFVCAFCLHQLRQGVFKENNEKPYCTKCHDKLFL
ncbi:leupaxin [Polypterus senegalus]|uniref:leupaxin n=1 Tax=Polypterus senegalus TaxID=55291 RepID=UPI001965C911|nr:leupaxin [Polypterus senegalus]